MDFAFNEEQQDLQGLAAQIFNAEISHERLKEVEGGEDNVDRELWAKLADAGILGIAVPEAQGGGGYGFLEAAVVLEQVGTTERPAYRSDMAARLEPGEKEPAPVGGAIRVHQRRLIVLT